MGLTIYFISGLGADKRAFEKIALPGEYVIKYIDWLDPNKDESLEAYAERLSRAINKTSPFVLVGLSFGGIVANEIARILHPKLTIIISSLVSRTQIPWYFQLIGFLNLDRIVPATLLKIPNTLTYKFFGAEDEDTSKLLAKMLSATDKKFLKWAIRRILTWKNTGRKPAELFHIHGSNDKIIPVRYVKPDVVVAGGGHFMVYNMSGKISEIVIDKLKSI